MKSVQLSELDPVVAAAIRNRETLEVRDGQQVIALVIPAQQTMEERIDQLAAEGKVTKGTGTFPDWFFTEPLPKCEGGNVLEQLLADRRKNDW
jgi:hypothetical protein